MDSVPDFRRLVSRVKYTPVPGAYDWSLLGGQHEWAWGIGLPYQALAGPRAAAVMPENPCASIADDSISSTISLAQSCGYWASLQSFLTYSFGWSRHDKGLIWWHEHGYPTEDARFALIDAVWRFDGHLLRYISWSIEHHPSAPLGRFARIMDSRQVSVSPQLADSLREAARLARPGGSPDGYHLQDGGHIYAPSRVPGEGGHSAPHSDARLVGVDPERRSATLISETVSGWYLALDELGGTLPKLPNHRNWRIDVYVRPIGFLGTFRRSTVTGLWFSGRHSLHVIGN